MKASIKQERARPRTIEDLLRRYDLDAIASIQKATENNVYGLNKTNATLEKFMVATLGSLENMQSQIDGNISTWFYSGKPTMANMPASEWTTTEDKDAHLGDLYYDKDTGYGYRFSVTDGIYDWIKLTDNDVVEALAIANAAQDTADGKRRVFTDTPSPPYDVGDLWFKSKEIYICNVSKPEGGKYESADFGIATKYTDDTKANEVADDLARNYSTTVEMNSAISKSASEILVTAAATYTTKNEFTNEIVALEDKYTAVSVKAEGLEVSVSSHETQINSLGARVTTAESSIIQHADLISLRVEKAGVISAINQSAETIKISAAKVELEGAVTFSALDDSTQTLINTASSNASSALATATTANDTANSALDAANNATPFIKGTQTAATGAWTGVAPFASLTDGQQITYWLPYAGSGNATLNLTLSTGSKTGAIACYYGGATRLTTHYPAGSAIRLTYRKNVAIGSATYTGWWADANYDSGNTYDRIRYTGTVKASAAIVAGNIIVGDASGYHHLKTGGSFDVSYPILYAAGSIANGGTGNNNYLAIAFSVGTTQSITLTAYKAVYIKGTLNGSKFTPVSTAPLTQTVPASDDGYYYILLGTAYATTAIYLATEHPIYRYKNGAFKTTAQISSEIAAWCYNNDVTYIDGGKIYAKSVTAAQIDVEDLFAQDITATNLLITGNSVFEGRLNGATGVFNGAIIAESIEAISRVNGVYSMISFGLNNEIQLQVVNENADNHAMYTANVQLWNWGDLLLSGHKIEYNAYDIHSFYGDVDVSGYTLTAGSIKTTSGVDLDELNSKMDSQIVAAGDYGFSVLTGTTDGKSFVRKNKLTGEVKIHFAAMNMNTSLTAVNTTFAQITDTYCPSETIRFFGVGFNGSTWQNILLQITSSGNIQQCFTSAYTYTRIYFDASWYTDFSDYELEA